MLKNKGFVDNYNKHLKITKKGIYLSTTSVENKTREIISREI
jgi:hypothetical protein